MITNIHVANMLQMYRDDTVNFYRLIDNSWEDEHRYVAIVNTTSGEDIVLKYYSNSYTDSSKIEGQQYSLTDAERSAVNMLYNIFRPFRLDKVDTTLRKAEEGLWKEVKERAELDALRADSRRYIGFLGKLAGGEGDHD
ncbi:hypothetical protein RQP50_21745 [Paenibacillus sp. chi10]|uniref:Uncharacterized protein n=1 Tax=Paenibacillus suaedae TaxID=3077233 RepID=A0AAJ2JXG3_9BACL|nr:hypothetical protein [Paenibacillus sp. chi10]MDT8978865.1 hypothetical protein [Paenibacillus sp. chi10]